MPRFKPEGSAQLKGDLQAIASQQKENEDEFLGKANVVGVAVGSKIKGGRDTEEPCLSVFVAQKFKDELLPFLREEDMIPPTVGKFKTDVVETGEIFAGATRVTPPRARSARFLRQTAPLPAAPLAPELAVDRLWAPSEAAVLEERLVEVAPQLLRQRMRPAQGGYSVGHYQVTAGTLATCVFEAQPFPGVPARYYILSNNHVLANSNAGRIGDPILQPGAADGGRVPDDVIARLSRFVTIRFDGTANLVDAALAEGPFQDLDREIYWIGYPKGVRFLQGIGDIVQKTGRTTNYSTGRVTHMNATVNVNYGGGRMARMERQIVTTTMSAGGDSGSLLLDMDENAVGLLFAGSPVVTIFNHILFVQSQLGIRIV